MKKEKGCINILHIAAMSNDRFNGMVNVIPEHVKAQSQYINVEFINLKQHRFFVKNNIKSYNFEDYKRKRIKELDNIKEFDLVVFHGIYLFDIWKFYLKHVYKKVPYIVIPHGSITNVALKKSKIKKFICNCFFVNTFTKNALAVQFLSKNEKKSTSKKFYTRSIVIGNGIDKKNKKSNVGTSKVIRLTYIGRIDNYYKGIDILLEACKECKQFMMNNSIKLTIYGNDVDGCRETDINYIEKYGLEDVVKLKNAVFEGEKQNILLNETDYFVLTSRSEGQPLAVLEALSYGIPVLLSDKTGLSKEIEIFKCGVIVNDNVDSIIDGIKHCYNNFYNIKNMSKNSLTCVEKYYWNVIAKKTIETYKKILSE